MKKIEIGDKKNVKRFAFLPVKINKKFIWLKTYTNIYEYKLVKHRVLLPVEGIVSEDGRPVFSKIFSRSEICEYKEWVIIEKIKKSKNE